VGEVQSVNLSRANDAATPWTRDQAEVATGGGAGWRWVDPS
jgi:hypothetical protein